ncbi:ribokinase isoform X2 [Castanea sativa]|uniref:ribokinase isoform X2 n=1 Tax=Castanea sativa TaxID=21020 RepID=UPI003F64BE0D
MRGIAISPSNQCCSSGSSSPLQFQSQNTLPSQPYRTVNLNPLLQFNNKKKQNPSNGRRYPIVSKISINPSNNNNTQTPIRPLVVFGSANADIYLEINRLPKVGETISANSGQTLAGGKGANQAACGGRLSYPTYFLGQPDGQNSIIIVGGANMNCWPHTLSDQDFEVVRNAGIVLLQREIPDSVNIQVAKAARSTGVPVILDAGGMDAPFPQELLSFIDILSPNESELGRLTGMATESFEQITQAVVKCHKMGVKQVLVKLGAKGSALFVEGEEPIKQPIISATKVLDTTGAGDTFTAAFAVALVEGKSRNECLKFAAAAASLCVQVKGAIPSMPDRKSVFDLLQSH